MIARRLLGAVQFLTVLPVNRPTASPGQCAAFFPTVGAITGALTGLLFVALREVVPPFVAALLAVGFSAYATGGLHEDGLADVADAFRAGRSRERILAILKDSRIGAHGALALMLVVLLRVAGLASIVTEDPVWSLAAVLAISRSAMVALVWITPPAGGGLGWTFSQDLSSFSAVLAILQGLLVAAVTPGGVLLLWGACTIVLGSRAFFVKRIGGVTGDCLGATALLVETYGLVLFSCRRCL